MQIRSKAARRLALGGAAFGAALALAWTPSPARAAPITFTFQSTVTAVNAPLSGLASVGDALNGQFTFESSTADANPNASLGLYTGAISQYGATVNSSSFASATGTVFAANDSPQGGGVFTDTWQAFTTAASGPTFGGYAIVQIFISMSVNGVGSAPVLSSDALPTDPSGFGGFTSRNIFLVFSDGSTSAAVTGHVDAVSLASTATPEPAALGLLGLGLAGLGALRRRRGRTAPPLLAAALAGAALAAASAPASATAIDFEDNLATTNNLSNPVKSRGFTFQEQSNSAGYVADGTLCSPGCADNGTEYLYTFGTSSVTTMTQDNGQAFSLVSVDLAELLEGPVFGPESAASVLVEGFLAGGGTVSQTFTLDGLNDSIGGAADFETFFFHAAFANLGSARFTAFDSTGNANGYLGLDNVVTAAVPEPAALGLLGLGLAGLGALRRRRGRATRAGALAAAALASTALSAAPSQAAPITFNITTQGLTFVQSPLTFALGDVFNLAITVESVGAIDQDPTPESGNYQAITSLAGSLGSYSFAASTGFVSVTDTAGPNDFINFRAEIGQASGSPVAGLPLLDFSIVLTVDTDLGSADIPAFLPPLSSISLSEAILRFGDGSSVVAVAVGGLTAAGTTQESVETPEPAALGLLGLGLAGLASLRRRRAA